jgi:hypothetical protein
LRFRSFFGASQQFFHAGFFSLRTIQAKIKFRGAAQAQTRHEFVSYIFFGCEQALHAAFGFAVVAIDIDEDLRRAAIVGHVDGGYAYQADAWVSEFAFDERFDFLAQSLAEPSAMMLNATPFHSSPQSKTHENIRKLGAGVGREVLLSRTRGG